MDSSRKLLPADKTRGITWYEFERICAILGAELYQKERQFRLGVDDMNHTDKVLYSTKDSLKSLKEITEQYEDDLSKMNAYVQLIEERINHVANAEDKLEYVNNEPPYYINTERVNLYTAIEHAHDEFLRNMIIMNQIKRQLKQLDNAMINSHGVENIKNGLNTLINVLNFLNKAIEQMESNVKDLILKTNELL